ncbi:MAG TPA: DUF2721 domain-containing protein [Cyclobacteriaceae bacterium]|nr:DUF2721 domain-containing protein [Cyclobacteriaceae bacterium]
MQFSINTPALLFPAITLLMLAYTNRFLGLSSLIRNLHTKLQQESAKRKNLHEQIKNLKRRLVLIKQMQAAGIVSFFLCVLSMLLVYFGDEGWAFAMFGLSLGFLLLSLALSLNEILISTRALEFELRDMEAN